jgi:hypothetical protein
MPIPSHLLLYDHTKQYLVKNTNYEWESGCNDKLHISIGYYVEGSFVDDGNDTVLMPVFLL